MHDTHACSRTSVQNSHTEFHENEAESLVADHRETLSMKGVFSLKRIPKEDGRRLQQYK